MHQLMSRSDKLSELSQMTPPTSLYENRFTRYPQKSIDQSESLFLKMAQNAPKCSLKVKMVDFLFGFGHGTRDFFVRTDMIHMCTDSRTFS